MLVRNPENITEIAQALTLAEKFHAQSEFSHRAFSKNKVSGLMFSYNADTSGDYLFKLVLNDAGEIIGGIMAFMTEPYFSEDRVAFDNGIFIDENKRGSRAAFLLLNEYVKWAVERGAKEVWFGETAGIAREAFAKLMAHCGFTNQGSFYRRIL